MKEKISVRSGMMFLLMVALWGSACKPPKDRKGDDEKMAGTATETMSYTHQNSATISPYAGSVLIDLGSEGFAWYSLPEGKELYRADDYTGVDLLGLSGNGLHWMEGQTLVSLDASGNRNSMPLAASGSLRCIAVSRSNQKVIAVSYHEGRSHLQLFGWGKGESPLTTLELPKTDQNFLRTNADCSILYVKGVTQVPSATWEGVFTLKDNEFQLLEENGPGPGIARSGPTLSTGNLAWGMPGGGIRIIDNQGKSSTMVENAQLKAPTEVRYAKDGKSILSIGTLSSEKPDEISFFIRLIDAESGSIQQEGRYTRPVGTQFFTDQGQALYALTLDDQGKPEIKTLPWQTK